MQKDVDDEDDFSSYRAYRLPVGNGGVDGWTSPYNLQ